MYCSVFFLFCDELNIIKMVYNVQFKWELNDFTRFIEKSTNNNGSVKRITSKSFSAGVDDMSHSWRIGITLKNDTKQIGIHLHLMDKPIKKPVSVQFHFELLDLDDSAFYKTFTRLHTFGKGHLSSCGVSNVLFRNLIFEKSHRFTRPIKIVAFLEFKFLELP